jgi:GxxExxY protein
MNRRSPREKERANELSHAVIGAAIEVHRHLGPGLLENAYQVCLCHELTLRGIPFDPQVKLPVVYKGLELDTAYRMDVVVADLFLLELKAVERHEAVFDAQVLTYLRLSGFWLGLLMNFNVPVMRDGIKRIVLD